ncbi:substrate-binding periplasmic protein [Aeromonas enteropelogenes]|uniref:substrate-binding periplasmic protein n=1 Tax=Aeromonas enteropelogenes TaxID=29489 RepID=UPI00398A43CB
MKWIFIPWLFLSLSLSAQPALTLLSHELPPFTYLHEGKLDGLAVRLVEEVQQELGEHQPIRVYPFKRGLALTRLEPGYALFVTQWTSERAPHYKWVGPLFLNRVVIYQPPGIRQTLTRLDQLRHLPRVGVVLGNADDERLTREGYTNLVRYQTVDEALQRLLLGKIDALPVGEMVLDAALERLGLSAKSVTNSGVILHDSWLYLAFGKSQDDAVITRWQVALDKVRAAHREGRLPDHKR